MEKYRPQYHFTPQANWMNDPNGMVYYEGEYHLFYQYYPESTVWGPMHWGHAVSRDLLQWEHLPVALAPDEKGYIFSGSCVIDWENTSGLGTGGQPPMIALFTYHDEAAKLAGATDYQSQGLAYSLDKGRTWTKYAENPVLPNSGIEDFRDPKVFWHQDTGRWIMSLAVANHIWFYSSTNLLDWTYESAFGHDQGAHGGVWECPDLFPLPIEGTEEEAWVLLVSVTEGGPNGGSATQYFVGHFDGCTFSVHPDAPDPELPTSPAKGAEPALWLDWGTDNYAGVTWSDIPSEDGRRIFLGWMSNWQYAQVVPTMTWRSAMTLPRVLSLAPDLRLRQAPIHPFDDYGKALETKDMYTTEAAQQTQLPLGQYLAFEADLSDAESFSLVLGDQEEYVSFTLTPKQGLMDLSREHSGETTFHQAFANPILGNWKGASPTVRYEVFVDESSVEIFLNGGEQVFSVLVFPSERYNQATFTANGKAVILKVVSKELSLQS